MSTEIRFKTYRGTVDKKNILNVSYCNKYKNCEMYINHKFEDGNKILTYADINASLSEIKNDITKLYEKLDFYKQAYIASLTEETKEYEIVNINDTKSAIDNFKESLDAILSIKHFFEYTSENRDTDLDKIIIVVESLI